MMLAEVSLGALPPGMGPSLGVTRAARVLVKELWVSLASQRSSSVLCALLGQFWTLVLLRRAQG